MAKRVLIAGLAFLLIAGCTHNYTLKRNDLSESSPWGFSRGDLAGQGSVNIAGFPGKLNVIWEAGISDKPIAPLTIYHDHIVYPGTKKRIRFIDLSNGHQAGQFKTKGLAQSGVVFQDSIGYYSLGPKRNRLSAVNFINLKRLWSLSVKDAAPGSIIVDNRLIVSSGDGRLSAYDLKSGNEAWTFQIRGKFVAPPTFGNGLVFQPDVRGTLYAVSISDGKEQFSVRAGGPLVSSAVIADKIYFADVSGKIYAADSAHGQILWQAQADGPLWTPPAIAREQVIVGTSRGLVQAFDAATGLPLWTVDCGEVVNAAPLVVNDYVIAGTMGGHLFLIRMDDGTVVDKKELRGAIAVSPVSDGRRVYVATQKGRIVCFGESNAQDASSVQRNHAENRSE